MISSLTFAFIVGAVSSVNPCGFALLPAYFARRLGMNTEDAPDRAEAVARALSAGAVTTGGFIIVFGIIGAVISYGAAWLNTALPWAGFVIGFGLVIIGLIVLSGRHVGLRLPKARPTTDDTGLRGDFYFGLGYGTASLSCTLPVFLSIVGVALTGSFVESALSFIAFALGMGTILTAIAIAAALSRDGLAIRFKKFLPYANRFGGAVLILAGLYVIFYWGSILLTDEIPTTSSLIGLGEQLSGFLRSIIGGDVGPTVVGALLLIFISIFGWSRWRRKIGNTPAALSEE